MKRRVPEPSECSGDDPPPELRVGKLIEVWADDGRDYFSAFTRYGLARRAWCKQRGLSTFEGRRRLPVSSSPWSSDFLIESGRRAEAERRLTEAGVTEADIPALRAAAEAYPRPD